VFSQAIRRSSNDPRTSFRTGERGASSAIRYENPVRFAATRARRSPTSMSLARSSASMRPAMRCGNRSRANRLHNCGDIGVRWRSLSIHHRSLPLGPARQIAVNSRRTARRRWSREPRPQSNPHGLPREARGRHGQTSWGPRGIPQSGPPSSTCSQGQVPLAGTPGCALELPSATGIGERQTPRVNSYRATVPAIETSQGQAEERQPGDGMSSLWQRL
jgi:hypothetical protein